MVQATVALRVDVDTRRGLEEGAPRLLELFRRRDLRATFFVTMGPDRSGRALRRALRPSFLRKMWRTNPFKLYGLRTLLSGTFLPAPLVGAGLPALLRQIAAEGHELAPHGWDHVGWQDRVHRLGRSAIRDDLESAARAFKAAVGVAPHASAAPGWRTSDAALSVQDALGFRYASDTRGDAPFRPKVADGVLATLQVPTTMPTMDELLGRVPDIPGALLQAVRPGLNVFTLHAEVEGGHLLTAFEAFLDALGRSRVRFARLDDVVDRLRAAADETPIACVVRGSVDGRSGWVAAPGWTRWHAMVAPR
ncbi:MAG: 4-deoxy-4-formamido-L-arabinose-phosphoundecaprenol deformylase [Candidatus Rokuibacteriota bacterium]|nr:MAG: 4-deoxy-4-formamido-L-arabinose-phosphoundecaprenol deformylase [Candidatus Rokubacteria bacterium]